MALQLLLLRMRLLLMMMRLLRLRCCCVGGLWWWEGTPQRSVLNSSQPQGESASATTPLVDCDSTVPHEVRAGSG